MRFSPPLGQVIHAGTGESIVFRTAIRIRGIAADAVHWFRWPTVAEREEVRQCLRCSDDPKEVFPT